MICTQRPMIRSISTRSDPIIKASLPSSSLQSSTGNPPVLPYPLIYALDNGSGHTVSSKYSHYPQMYFPPLRLLYWIEYAMLQIGPD